MWSFLKYTSPYTIRVLVKTNLPRTKNISQPSLMVI